MGQYPLANTEAVLSWLKVRTLAICNLRVFFSPQKLLKFVFWLATAEGSIGSADPHHCFIHVHNISGTLKSHQLLESGERLGADGRDMETITHGN